MYEGRVEPKVTWAPTELTSYYDYDNRDWTGRLPEGVTVDEFDGFCPVQGHGSLDGLRWYFRARHQHWQFHVARTDQDVFINDLFYCDIDWPGEMFSAGYMAPEDALKCLHLAVALYRQEKTA